MGKAATEIGVDETTLVTAVTGAPKRPVVAAGTADGRVWAAELATSRRVILKADKGAPITALALSLNAARLAWGDEDGGAGVIEVAF
jgi:hypothetical protein